MCECIRKSRSNNNETKMKQKNGFRELRAGLVPPSLDFNVGNIVLPAFSFPLDHVFTELLMLAQWWWCFFCSDDGCFWSPLLMSSETHSSFPLLHLMIHFSEQFSVHYKNSFLKKIILFCTTGKIMAESVLLTVINL